MPHCSVCGTSLDRWLESESGGKFCSDECFMATWPQCGACGRSMKQWQVAEDGQKFCSERCAMTAWPQCEACGMQMREWQVAKDGKKFCSEECSMTIWPLCDACGTPMQQWQVAEDGRKFCSERCTMTTWPKCVICSSPMDQWLVTKDGERFCSERCFATTWPRCSICSIPIKSWSETSDGKKLCSIACASSVLPTCDCCGIPMEKWYSYEEGTFCSNRCYNTESQCQKLVARAVTANVSGELAVGASISTIGSAGQYADNVVMGANQGHGFAAEKANHLVDKALGQKASLIGQDNVKDGADRRVEGIEIQTKYCGTGAKCIESCFKNGEFRYFRSDGVPMQIEVPSDKYDDAVKALERKITDGKVRGVSDPAKAKDLIRKGHFTHQQAINIAKFCTVESLLYDAATGSVFAARAAGLTALVTLARAVWQGDDLDSALTQSCKMALQVGGVSFASYILTQQLGRTGISKTLRGMTDEMVKKMDPSKINLLVNFVRGGKKVGGAAAQKNLSKLMSGGVLASASTVALISSVDIYRMINGGISGGQLFKNVATTASGVAASAAGKIAAGVLLSSPVGVAGAVVGFVGSIVVGSLGSSATKAVLDKFIKEDTEMMFNLFKDVLTKQAAAFLLNEAEICLVMDEVNTLDLAGEMRSMYGSDNRNSYAVSIIRPIIVKVVVKRGPVYLPSNQQVLERIGSIIVS